MMQAPVLIPELLHRDGDVGGGGFTVMQPAAFGSLCLWDASAGHRERPGCRRIAAGFCAEDEAYMRGAVDGTTPSLRNSSA